MNKFRIGDKVERTIAIYNKMKVGDTDIVTNIVNGNLRLKKYGDGHSPDSFKLYKEPKPLHYDSNGYII